MRRLTSGPSMVSSMSASTGKAHVSTSVDRLVYHVYSFMSTKFFEIVSSSDGL
jgi:hypothetical protein